MRFTNPKRMKNSRKGDNGRILVVGGSKEYAGAPMLAGVAALRSGCDWVVLAAPAKVAWAANAYSPDLMTVKLSGDALSATHYNSVRKQRFDTLLIGNGVGLKPGTQALMRKLARLPVQKVIDADGIKALKADDVFNAILTPNKNELKIFLKNSGVSYTENPKILRGKLKAFFDNGNTLLVKGQIAQIINGSDAVKLKLPNPGMTKAGTGDVIAGLCAGYLAQLEDPFQAAQNAIIMAAKASKALQRKHGYTYLASELPGAM